MKRLVLVVTKDDQTVLVSIGVKVEKGVPCFPRWLCLETPSRSIWSEVCQDGSRGKWSIPWYREVSAARKEAA